MDHVHSQRCRRHPHDADQLIGGRAAPVRALIGGHHHQLSSSLNLAADGPGKGGLERDDRAEHPAPLGDRDREHDRSVTAVHVVGHRVELGDELEQLSEGNELAKGHGVALLVLADDLAVGSEDHVVVVEAPHFGGTGATGDQGRADPHRLGCHVVAGALAVGGIDVSAERVLPPHHQVCPALGDPG